MPLAHGEPRNHVAEFQNSVLVPCFGQERTAKLTRNGSNNPPVHSARLHLTRGVHRRYRPCVAHDRMDTQWAIHGERLVDSNPHISLSIASVELPDGTTLSST